MIFQTALILTHHYSKISYFNYNLILPSSILSNFFGTNETLIQATIPFLVALGYASYFILLDPIAGVSSISLNFKSDSFSLPRFKTKLKSG